MKVIVNGQERNVNNTQLDKALQELSLSTTYAAVALNWTCVPNSQLAQTELKEGDLVEILVPQSGG